MSRIRSFAKPVLVALVVAGTLGGCAVYVPPGGYYGGGYYGGYYGPGPYYYRGYYGRSYFR